MRHDSPFDISVNTRISGRTQVDGEIIVVTGAIIFDKLKDALEEMKLKGQIKEYMITVRDNLADAEETIEKNK